MHHYAPKTVNRSPSTGRKAFAPASPTGAPKTNCALNSHSALTPHALRTFSSISGL